MDLKRAVKQVLIALPPFRRWLQALQQENDSLRWHLKQREEELAQARSEGLAESQEPERANHSETIWAPIGHFYSPVPAVRDIQTSADEIFEIPAAIRGVNLNEERQFELLKTFAELYVEQPFTEHKRSDRRYYFDNPNYSYADAISLYCMIRHLRPKRIIEIGSGFSSCAMLDVNELFFANSIDCTFIEPYPQLLRSLVKDSDRQRIRILGQRLQDVDPGIFRELTDSDILFIDSSHVAKTGSDLNYILFKVLPLLSAGVHIHFHDIFYPFEYPQNWVYEGRAWNEAYFLRAFMEYNSTFEIEYFSTYLLRRKPEIFESAMPLCLKNTGGNIWLKKTFQDPQLDRVYECAERKLKPFPTLVAPARPEYLWLLGEGWHGGETDHCWMGAQAAVRIAGPNAPDQRLRVRGYNPHDGGAKISITVDDFPLRPVELQSAGRVDVELPLPKDLIGRAAIRVDLEIDRTYIAPNDPRTLGLMIVDIEVR